MPLDTIDSMVAALGIVTDWLKKLSPTERMAVFGALQDLWCHACGSEVDACKCRRYKRTMEKLTRSTVGRKNLDAVANTGCRATVET